MNEPKPGSGRWQLAFIAFVFFGPLILASWMYMTGRLTPESRTNHGALLEPIVNLEEVLPSSPVVTLADGQWLMLYANQADCGDSCRESLHRLRQTRLMLGDDMDRIVRVFLHGESAPDKVFLDGEHPGLKTIKDKGLWRVLEDKRPSDLVPNGIYLIDPLTNLVMYFPPDLDPREMVDDLKHLLELSRIG